MMLPNFIENYIQNIIDKRLKPSKRYAKYMEFAQCLSYNLPIPNSEEIIYSPTNNTLINFIKFQCMFLRKSFGQKYYFFEPRLIFRPFQNMENAELGLRFWIIRKDELKEILKDIKEQKKLK